MNILRSYSDGPYHVVFPTLLEEAPFLERFSSDETQLISQPACWKNLARFKHLRYLSIDSDEELDDRGLKKIFSFTHLTELCLFLGSPSIQISLPNAVHLPSLRSLVISALPFVIDNVLHCLAHTPLSSMRILYYPVKQGNDNPNGEQLWKSRLEQVLPWSASLLHLEFRERSPAMFEAQAISILDPLLVIGRLESLTFLAPIGIDVTDEDFRHMARCWPELVNLDIDLRTSEHARPEATLATLEAFATHCPRLRTLHLPLNLAHLPPVPLVSTHPLEELYISYVASSDPSLLARYLDALFPYLYSLRGHPQCEMSMLHQIKGENGNGDDNGNIDQNRGRWQQVTRILKTCQAVRQHYRQRSNGYISGLI